MGLGPGVGCCSAGTDPSPGRAPPVRDEEELTDWSSLTVGRNRLGSVFIVVGRLFLTPILRFLSAHTLLGKRKFFLGESTDCIFF